MTIGIEILDHPKNQIKIKIQAVDSLGNFKNHGGDEFIVRATLCQEKSNLLEKNFYLLGKVTDFSNGFYTADFDYSILKEITSNNIFNTNCFKIQVFLVRTAELQKAVQQIFYSPWHKTYNWMGYINDRYSDFCTAYKPAISELSPYFDDPENLPEILKYLVRAENLWPDHPYYCFLTRFQYYDSLKKARDKGQKLYWKFQKTEHDIEHPFVRFGEYLEQENFGFLDKITQELVFEKNITIINRFPVSKNEDSGLNLNTLESLADKVNNSITENFFTFHSGFWLTNQTKQYYFDPKIPITIDDTNIINNQTLILMNDSTARQMEYNFEKSHRNNTEIIYDFSLFPRQDPKNYNSKYCLPRKDNADHIGHGLKYKYNKEKDAKVLIFSPSVPLFNDYGCSERELFAVQDVLRLISEASQQTLKTELIRPKNGRFIFVITEGFHYSPQHPIVFYKQLKSIKNAILNYKNVANSCDQNDENETKRVHCRSIQNSIFIYKTPNYIRPNFKFYYNSMNMYILKLYRTMIYKVFDSGDDETDEKLKNLVHIYDIWSMSSVIFDHLTVDNLHIGHLPGETHKHLQRNVSDIMPYDGFQNYFLRLVRWLSDN